MKTYVSKLDNGYIKITKLLKEGVDIYAELKRIEDNPDFKGARVVSVHEIDESQIPEDRTYRDAWCFDEKEGFTICPKKKHEIDVKAFRQERSAAYPDIGDQLDAIMKWINGGSFDSPPKELVEIAKKCMEVKRKYPKGGK